MMEPGARRHRLTRPEASAVSEQTQMSIANHPRAPGSIMRIRARFAVAAVGLLVLVSLRAGHPYSVIATRAVLAGLIGYFAGWAVGVTVWREIVKLEFRAAVRRHVERRRS
jgi:uncharacterized membrane protein YccC